MTTSTLRCVLLCLVPASVVCAADALARQDHPAPATPKAEEEKAVQVQYLEIVTPDVDATCAVLEKQRGVRFGEPEAELGNARTAALKGGGRIGVRAPMHEAEEPVVRPYLLVDDIEAAVETARAAGGEIALPPTEIAGRGRFAIYFLGGIQHGLWQL